MSLDIINHFSAKPMLESFIGFMSIAFSLYQWFILVIQVKFFITAMIAFGMTLTIFVGSVSSLKTALQFAPYYFFQNQTHLDK